MKIKTIYKSKKYGNYCLITTDGESLYVSEDIILKYSLRKDKELGTEVFLEIMEAQKLINVKQSAYNYASYKPRTVAQVKDKLKLLGYENVLIDKAVEFLKDFNLLDDEKFASEFVHSYLKRKNAGSRKIYFELLKKGIHKDLAKDAVESNFPENDKFELALAASEKKMKAVQSKTPEKQKNSLIAYLQRQGFDWDTIRLIISKYFKDEY